MNNKSLHLQETVDSSNGQIKKDIGIFYLTQIPADYSGQITVHYLNGNPLKVEKTRKEAHQVRKVG